MHVQTVDENEKMFTERDMLKWKEKLRWGWTSVINMVVSIKNGYVMKIPVTKVDIDNAI